MNEIAMLREAEPRKILQMVAEEQVPAIMSYLSGGKWRVAKVLLIECGAGSFSVEISPNKAWTHKPHPMNIRLEGTLFNDILCARCHHSLIMWNLFACFLPD